jgi:hypothetical protein
MTGKRSSLPSMPTIRSTSFLLINTDDAYSYSRDHHYSINDTTVYSEAWFSEDTHSGELVASLLIVLMSVNVT